MHQLRRSTTSVGSAQPYLLIAAMAVTSHVAVTLWRLRTSYFSLDDFRVMGLAHRSPLSLSYLTSGLSGHAEPFSLLVEWAFTHLVGWNYGAAETILVSMSAGAVGMIAAIGRRTQSNPVITFIAAMSAALAWVTIEPNSMWNNGVQVITSTLLVMVAIFICAKPSRSLTLAERVLLAAAVVAASAFYNKAFFAIIVCGAIRLFVADSLRPDVARPALWRSVRSALADILVAMIGLGALLALVAAVNLGAPSEHAVLDVGKSLSGLAVGVQYGWFGGSVGLRVDSSTSMAADIIYAVLIDAILASIVAATILYNRRTIWIWIGLVVAIGLSNYFISLIRVALFGPMFMAIARYHTDEVFMTVASSVVAFGRAFVPESRIPRARTPLAQALLYVGLILPVLQFVGGVHYPPVWDTQGNRRFVERLERSASALSTNQSVGERLLPEHVVYRWLLPWNYLSNLAPMLPRPLRTASWDQATHYMDDDANLRAFADLPRQRFEAFDGADLVLSMAPPFENVGYLDKGPADRASGWFNPILAPPAKVRIAIVAHGRIIAWADRVDRPDVGAFFFGVGNMQRAGFSAALPPGVSHDEVSAVAVIDNRIGVTLPRG